MNELRQIINDSGYKMQYIAHYLDISKQALSKKMRGESGWNTNQITLICKLLNLDSEALVRIFFDM